MIMPFLDRIRILIRSEVGSIVNKAARFLHRRSDSFNSRSVIALTRNNQKWLSYLFDKLKLLID